MHVKSSKSNHLLERLLYMANFRTFRFIRATRHEEIFSKIPREEEIYKCFTISLSGAQIPFLLRGTTISLERNQFLSGKTLVKGLCYTIRFHSC